MNDTSLRLNQRRAIQALVDGQTKQQAATAARVVPATLSRWLTEDNFKDALSQAGDEALRSASVRLKAGLDTAIDTLLAVMQDDSGDTHASVRIRAADMLLSHTLRLAELVDLAERVTQLEAVTNG